MFKKVNARLKKNKGVAMIGFIVIAISLTSFSNRPEFGDTLLFIGIALVLLSMFKKNR